MTSIRPGMSRQKPSKAKTPAWMPALDNILILAGVALVVSIGFLVFVLLSGQLAAPIIQGTALEVIQRNMTVWHKVFTVALWVLVVVGLIRHYRVDSVGYLIGLGGVACWWLLPMMVTAKATGAASQLLALSQSLIASFQATGGALIVIGFLRVVIGRIIAIAYSPQGAATSRLFSASAIAEIAEERTKARPSLMRRCWELHFCRGSLRVTCPRFIEGASCWKKESGCYCDQGLASRLLSGMAAKARVQVAEELEAAQSRAQAYNRSAAAHRQRQARKKVRTPCRECPLYLEHQKYKYRALSWLAYPLAALIVAFLVPKLHAAYQWLETNVGGALSEMRFLPHSLTDAPLQQAPWFTAENAMMVMFGVLVVAAVLQLLEIGIFRFKL